jgi:hypothetical protein
LDDFQAATARLGKDLRRVGDRRVDLLTILKLRIDAASRGQPVVLILDQD